MEVRLFKPTTSSILGITLEPSSGYAVVVAALQPGFVAAESGLLRRGDVIHEVEGEAISSAEHGGRLLQAASGSVRISLTREYAKPKNGWVTPWSAGCAPEPCAVASSRSGRGSAMSGSGRSSALSGGIPIGYAVSGTV